MRKKLLPAFISLVVVVIIRVIINITGFESEYFSVESNLAVDIFDPFVSTIFDSEKVDREYVTYLGPEMAISTGLATRKVPF